MKQVAGRIRKEKKAQFGKLGVQTARCEGERKSSPNAFKSPPPPLIPLTMSACLQAAPAAALCPSAWRLRVHSFFTPLPPVDHPTPHFPPPPPPSCPFISWSLTACFVRRANLCIDQEEEETQREQRLRWAGQAGGQPESCPAQPTHRQRPRAHPLTCPESYSCRTFGQSLLMPSGSAYLEAVCNKVPPLPLCHRVPPSSRPLCMRAAVGAATANEELAVKKGTSGASAMGNDDE